MTRKALTVVGVFFLFSCFVLYPSPGSTKSDLEIKSNPSNISVELEDDRAGTTPFRTTVGSEDLGFTMSGKGYNLSSNLKLEGDMGITFNLDSLDDDPPYRVLFLSEPSNAHVTVDGEPRGRTPWTGTLSTGRHIIEVNKKGHRTWTANIDIRSAFSATARLSEGEPSPSRDVLDTRERKSKTEKGKTVQQSQSDDKDVEKAEGKLRRVMPVEEPETGFDEHPQYDRSKIKDTSDRDRQREKIRQPRKTKTEERKKTAPRSGNGQYQQAEAPSDSPIDDPEPTQDPDEMKSGIRGTESIEEQRKAEQAVKDQQDQPKTESKLPDTVPLKIESNPSGARLFVNGREVGKTPFVKQDFSSGTSTIRLTRNGYQVWKETFYLDEATQLKIQMKPKRAYLSIRPNPSALTVDIGDNTFEVEGNQSFQVDPGTYEVRARADGYSTYDTTVTLRQGTTRALEVNLNRVPKVWDYPTTRDVFMRMARNHLGDLVESFGIEAGHRVSVVPSYRDWAHNLMNDVLTLVMNRNAILVVDSPASRMDDGSLDREFKFYIVQMDVTYDDAGKQQGVRWLKRHFDLKINAKLIRHKTGEVQYTKFFHRTGEDRIPAKFKEELRQPYEPPETEPPLTKE